MISTLTSLASTLISEEFGSQEVVTWSVPKELDHGDLSTSVALGLSKKLGKKPREIAEFLVQKMQGHPLISRVEIAGPGYVNVWLSPKAYVAMCTEAGEACVAKPVRNSEAPVIIEYSQPNIAKPLGVHHIIGTVLGQSLCNLYRHAGYNVIAWNYIGDWGTQFGKLAVAFQKWGTKSPRECSLDELLALYAKFHAEADSHPELEDEGRAAFRALEQGDEKLREFWRDIVEVTKSSLRGIYERLQVSFDLDLGESYYEDKMGPILEDGKKRGVFVPGKEGALIVEFSEASKLPPYMVLKGDGATLYSTRDIAQMRYRMDTYHPAQILICTDVAQKLHFEQLAATCEKLGWSVPGFENVLFGRMRFADGKMSTRRGTVLKLEHVLDEAHERAAAVIAEHKSLQVEDAETLAEMMGVGALVYGILSQNRKLDIVFDWDKMLSFEGNSAPYLQYTFARAQSLLRKAEVSQVEMPVVDGLTASERALVRTLSKFEAVLNDARTQATPHALANFLFTLSQDFNTFYNAEDILKAAEPVRTFRLALTSLFARVLQSGAHLLTLRLPERM